MRRQAADGSTWQDVETRRRIRQNMNRAFVDREDYETTARRRHGTMSCQSRWCACRPACQGGRLIRQRESAYLASYIDAYIASRTDSKPRTRSKFNTTKTYPVEFFTADQNLRDITAGDADDWRVFLLAKGMSENTVRKHTQIASSFSPPPFAGRLSNRTRLLS